MTLANKPTAPSNPFGAKWGMPAVSTPMGAYSADASADIYAPSSSSEMGRPYAVPTDASAVVAGEA